MHFDKAYVIGVEGKSTERLNRFFASCETAGVKAELFNAVNGAEINYDQWQKEGYLSSDFELRMPGSLGCLLSHVTLWEKINSDPDIKVALICEDDAVLDKEFLRKLEEIPWDEVPKDWDMIRLAGHKITGEPVSEHLLKPPTQRRKGTNAGTFCYLVNAKTALKMKQVLIPYKNRQSMDVLLQKNSDKYNLYVLKKPLAREIRYRYSVRNDLNLNHKKENSLKKLIVNLSAKWLR